MPTQHEVWNELLGPGWAAHHRAIDRSFGFVEGPLLGRLELVPGDTVLDVGCGCGDAFSYLSRAVGAEGSVVGVDLSAPMVDEARRYAAELGLGNVETVLADVATWSPGRRFGAVHARSCLMFLSEPAVAVTRLVEAMDAGGRFAASVWQGLGANPWMVVPVVAAAPVVGFPPMPAADEPGPFAFEDPDRLAGVLRAAGLRDVAVEPVTAAVRYPADDLRAQAEAIVFTGPLALLVADAAAADPGRRDAVVDAVADALAEHVVGAEVVFEAGAWIGSGRR